MFRIVSSSGWKIPFCRKYTFGRHVSTLTFIEATSNGKITNSSLSALYASGLFSNNITALLVGPNASEAAENIKTIDCPQLKKVLIANSPKFESYIPENITPLLVKLLKADLFSHFLVAASAVGKNLLPRVGAMLDVQPVSDVVAVKDEKTFVRPIYAGNIFLTLEDTQEKKLISVRSSSFPALGPGFNNAVVEEAPVVETPDAEVTWLGANLVQSQRPDLASATKVVSGGRGLKNKETFDQLVTPLADALGAGIGATRAAVDSGFCKNSLQIGQTGKIISPDLYIALGISGAIQHLAGMKDSKVIVAINKDPKAPIFEVADYGIVGDLNEIVPELTRKL